MAHQLKVLAFTHKNLSLSDIGKLHLDVSKREEVLNACKEALQLEELLYLSTCNRIEFVMSAESFICGGQTQRLLSILQPEFTGAELSEIASKVQHYEGDAAARHLFEVAASLDSMVLGEREIITQVRKAFEESREMNLSGDLIRIAIKYTLAAGKRVYTDTHIARNPVSVVSLAWKALQEKCSLSQSRVIVIGGGQIIRNISRFLAKAQPTSVTLYNRSPEKTTEIESLLRTTCKPLSELQNHTGGFDILITCTGAEHSIVDENIYNQLVGSDSHEKFIVDLALPADVDADVIQKNNCHYIGMEQMQAIAQSNMALRSAELEKCETILDEVQSEFDKAYQQRMLELALKDIPQKIKEIKETALGQVFAKELGDLDEQSIAVLEKVMAYMEKKYISLPMKMAKEVMIDKIQGN